MTWRRPYQFVIFAGGKGTRLGSLGAKCPKPAVDIDGAPLVSYLIDWAIKQTFTEIIIASGHLQEILSQCLSTHYNLTFLQRDEKTRYAILEHGQTLIIRDTGKETLTADRLYLLRDLLCHSDRFVLTYGDTLTNLDFNKPLALADKMDKPICLVAGHPDARYGELIIENNIVTKFREKAQPRFFINRGFFIIKSEIFNKWDKENFHSFEENVIPHFAEKHNVVAYQSDAWFFSVDSEVDAQRLTNLLRKDK